MFYSQRAPLYFNVIYTDISAGAVVVPQELLTPTPTAPSYAPSAAAKPNHPSQYAHGAEGATILNLEDASDDEEYEEFEFSGSDDDEEDSDEEIDVAVPGEEVRCAIMTECMSERYITLFLHI